jgi:hypothetical protein
VRIGVSLIERHGLLCQRLSRVEMHEPRFAYCRHPPLIALLKRLFGKMSCGDLRLRRHRQESMTGHDKAECDSKRFPQHSDIPWQEKDSSV